MVTKPRKETPDELEETIPMGETQQQGLARYDTSFQTSSDRVQSRGGLGQEQPDPQDSGVCGRQSG